ncbi:DUF2840 domain-containing protein [Sphingomonas sp. BT-65]|uniref:DUF2840 domain-containing protein n=1 Tax=Sphingomonas sp. BT-65 TaxID=2989821 RepID=UPI0022364DE8|nr:DUF2840 domain-containing protein [Sphingomonas sp. BT-65]MCW4460803.1 DUF2840 domain-containing protein [Sphingomonas sp. BT-65]
MTLALTAVHLLHRRERADRWLRFGAPVAERRRGRHSLALFAPGQCFGLVDWEANEFGTIRWRFAVLRAASPGALVVTLRGIQPGAELLIDAAGKGPAKRALAFVDAIEAAGGDPAALDPDHWRAAGTRLAVRDDPRPFDRLAQGAAAARRSLAP